MGLLEGISILVRKRAVDYQYFTRTWKEYPFFGYLAGALPLNTQKTDSFKSSRDLLIMGEQSERRMEIGLPLVTSGSTRYTAAGY